MDMLKTGDILLYSRPTTSWVSSITGILSRNNSNKPKTEYIHCGMILRDPTFIDRSLKGLYVWQSRWPYDDSDSESESSSESESEVDESENEEQEDNEGNENNALANLKDTDNGLNDTAKENKEAEDDEDDDEYDDIEIEILPLKQVLDECDCPDITARTIVCENSCFSPDKLKTLHKAVTEKPEIIFPREEIKEVLGQCDLSTYDWSATFLGYLYSKCNILSKETKWHLLRPQDFAANTENLRFNKSVSLDDDEFDLN